MISNKITIRKEILNPEFVVAMARLCSSFNSSIIMYAKEQTVNLKSIVNIFGTRLSRDEEVELVFTGNDEEEASKAIIALFEQA